MVENKKRPFKKIHIIGEVGSGKTYLAKRLSETLEIPYFQLDNVVWTRGVENDTRNSAEVRDRVLNEILDKDLWIIEGVHFKWVLRSFELSDVIIYLDLNVFKRDCQIISRFIKEKMGIEVGNYTQSFLYLIKMLKWSHSFEKERKPQINEILRPYSNKIQYYKNNVEAISQLTL